MKQHVWQWEDPWTHPGKLIIHGHGRTWRFTVCFWKCCAVVGLSFGPPSFGSPSFIMKFVLSVSTESANKHMKSEEFQHAALQCKNSLYMHNINIRISDEIKTHVDKVSLFSRLTRQQLKHERRSTPRRVNIQVKTLVHFQTH